jgi:hypothetical protein
VSIYNKPDLGYCSAETLGRILSDCAQLGARHAHEGAKDLTGQELADHFCSGYRRGHMRILRLAYSAGRWHEQHRSEEE